MEAMKLVTVTCDGWGMLHLFMNRFREKYRMIVGGVRLRSKYQRRRLLACSTVNNKHGSKMLCPNKSNGFNV